jgi:hypothetical protein
MIDISAIDFSIFIMEEFMATIYKKFDLFIQRISLVLNIFTPFPTFPQGGRSKASRKAG